MNKEREAMVYVFRHKTEGVVVCGQTDAENVLDNLKSIGYKHTQTINAPLFLEGVINMKSTHDVWDAIHCIDQ